MDELDRLRGALNEAQREIAAGQRTITELRNQAAEQQRETQHHIHNTLSVIRSIVRRTITEGDAVEDYQARLDSRLACFIRLETKVLRNPDGLDLGDLVADELLTFAIRLGVQARIEGPPVLLTHKAAGVLGLAFHELALLSVESGQLLPGEERIGVRWCMDAADNDPNSLMIDWIDDYCPIETGFTSRSVSTHEIIEQAVIYELGGTVQLDLTGRGLRCRFHLSNRCLAKALA